MFYKTHWIDKFCIYNPSGLLLVTSICDKVLGYALLQNSYLTIIE